MTGLERSSDIDLQSERLTSLQEMRTSYLPHLMRRCSDTSMDRSGLPILLVLSRLNFLGVLSLLTDLFSAGNIYKSTSYYVQKVC